MGMDEQVLIGAICFLLGVVVVYLWKQQSVSALQRHSDRIEQERDRLNETLESREAELREQRENLQTSETEKVRLESDLNNAQNAVEERNSLLEKREREKETLNNQWQKANNDVARLTTELKNSENAETRLSNAFKVLVDSALDEMFKKSRQVAQDDQEKSRKAVAELVNPLKETLSKLENRTEKLADERKESHTKLETVISNLMQFSHQAQVEVRKLSQAMSQSQTRGSWGEYVLEQILKFSGLQENIHYDKQVTLEHSNSKQKARPDFVIKLPSGRKLVIDAKTSFKAFEQAALTDNENERSTYLQQHALQVKNNLDELARVDYLPFIQENYGETSTPDYVVMFLPSDALYHAALERLPKLAQEGFQKRVILTSPTTLFALIGVINLGFREDAIAAEAEEINKRGNELYKRSVRLVDLIIKIGSGIRSSVDSYNEAIGSWNLRYIPMVEKFKELESISGDEFPELKEISDSLRQPRLLSAPENQDVDTEENNDGFMLPNS